MKVVQTYVENPMFVIITFICNIGCNCKLGVKVLHGASGFETQMCIETFALRQYETNLKYLKPKP
jgi:hypothetical protein